MKDIKVYYFKKIKDLSEREIKLEKKEKYFILSRLSVVIIGLILFYKLFSLDIALALIVAFLFCVLFLIVVKLDLKNSQLKNFYHKLKIINQRELDFINFKFNLSYNGTDYIDKDHPYTSDLNIFGNYSLFQYINRASTKIGMNMLADWLKLPATIKEIQNRQEAIKELKDKIDWRQKICAVGLKFNDSSKDLQNVTEWLKEPVHFLSKKILIVICSILPLITIVVLIASFIIIPLSFALLFVLLHFVIIHFTDKKILKIHAKISGMAEVLSSYSEILSIIGKEKFTSVRLQELKSNLLTNKSPAYYLIKCLSKILDRLDYRFNIFVHFPLNSLFFWDIHHIVKLEKWKEKYKNNIESWFATIAEIEALSSFANLLFNNPDWVFPKFVDNYFIFSAKELGHPLIQLNRRVSNNFELTGPAKIVILTGSNMSGKSTFLRTVGVNIVLAMSGAPVCAQEFKVSPIMVLTSMNVFDSLAESTSTFYAELKRIETIIKSVKRSKKVFILMDEILKGTNSIDRHTGSKALVKQLINNNAIGIIASHDLKLTNIARENPDKIENYNFNIQLDNNELLFDYKLNKGICRSSNATTLMRKIGIDI